MRLSKEDIIFFDLKVDERVIFYDEDFQIEAIIKLDENEQVLYGEFDSDYIYISKDIEEARRDGFLNGQCFGELIMRNRIIRSMNEYEIPKELIMKITQTNEDDLRRLFSNEY